jgi:hypothetical protein
VYLNGVSYYGSAPDLAPTKEADALLRAREPHEALVERVQVEEQSGLGFFVRLVPAFARRTKATRTTVNAPA